MRGFLQRTGEIVLGSLIVNFIYISIDKMPSYNIPEPRPTYAVATPPPTTFVVPKPTNTSIPPTNTLSANTQIIYVFNLAPIRLWFDKNIALQYREALLDGKPVREFISVDKSQTFRGGRMFVLKQEDGLIMVKVENTEIIGWIQ